MVRKKKEEKTKTGLRKFIGAAFLILVVVQVILANSLVARGREITYLDDEREQLWAEITTLENAIAQSSSLTIIRQKAKELGMKLGKIEFLPPPPLASAD